jgi:hypothetical protein
MRPEPPALPEPDSTPVAPPRQTTAYLKDLFSQVGFTIDARRGQNFLVDLNLLDLLARSAAIAPDDVVLEVGTGTGALTERLAAMAARVVALVANLKLRARAPAPRGGAARPAPSRMRRPRARYAADSRSPQPSVAPDPHSPLWLTIPTALCGS